MKLIGSKEQLQVFSGETLEVLDKLPAGTYELVFSSQQGFFLNKVDDLSTNTKVYGDTEKNTDMVLRAYSKQDKNLGVILSGTPGMGKTLFARMLSAKAREQGIPTILINNDYPGIPSFIESLEQQVMVLFDEFEKRFEIGSGDDDEGSANTGQSRLLSMFDGLSSRKNLYVVTYNDEYRISKFLLNRPGRFHYNFKFNAVDHDSLEEFMQDKVGSAYESQRRDTEMINTQLRLTYDQLNALAFEINLGNNVKDAIEYLNIKKLYNSDTSTYYNMTAELKDGKKVSFGAHVMGFGDTYNEYSDMGLHFRNPNPMEDMEIDSSGNIQWNDKGLDNMNCFTVTSGSGAHEFVKLVSLKGTPTLRQNDEQLQL